MERREVVLERDLLDQGGRLAGAPVHPSAGEDVEGGDTLGDADGMVVPVRREGDPVTDADALGARRHEREEDLGGGGVRVLVEPVVLDLPDAVVAQPVGELGLLEAVPEALGLLVAGGAGDLHLEEEGELHAGVLSPGDV